MTREPPQTMDFRHLAAENLGPELAPPQNTSAPRLLTEQELRSLERENLIAVLKHTKWKVAGPGGAAEFLGVNPATLASRIRALGISR